MQSRLRHAEELHLIVVAVLFHALLQVQGGIPALLGEVVPIAPFGIHTFAPILPHHSTALIFSSKVSHQRRGQVAHAVP